MIITAMGDMPMIDLPIALSSIEVGFGILFLTGFFVMKLESIATSLAVCQIIEHLSPTKIRS
jgi:hypothetical protein